MSGKKYVFLQATAAGIGGVRMYGIAKSAWPKKVGWDVVAVYAYVDSNPDCAVVGFIWRFLFRVKNVNLLLLGEFSPLPRKPLGSSDVVIAKVGRVGCCLESSVLSIAYRMDGDVPLGAAYYDVPFPAIQHNLCNKIRSSEDCLERALVEQAYTSETYPYERLTADFTSHQKFRDRIMKANRERAVISRSVAQKPRSLSGCLHG